MPVSKKFISGSQELSNKISWVLSEILYFNDTKFKFLEPLVSLELTSALNSSLKENNLNKIELPNFLFIAYYEQQCYGNRDMQFYLVCDSLKPVP